MRAVARTRWRFPTPLTTLAGFPDFFVTQVCDNTGSPQEGATTHTVLLAGTFLTGEQVLAIVNLRMEGGGRAVGMRLSVRSASKDMSGFVASCVA